MGWLSIVAPALVFGSLLALLSAPLGCLVVWRRMAFFSDTLAHGTLLGVAIAFMLYLPISVGLLITSIILVLLLWVLYDEKLPNDAVLGGISSCLLALGMVLISSIPELKPTTTTFLFGDLLTMNWEDVLTYGAVCFICIVLLFVLWKKQLTMSINKELAIVAGIKVKHQQLYFMLILASFSAIALQAVGSLLVSSLLVLPALSARLYSHSPKTMLVLAILMGQVGIVVGIASSVYFDIATGLAIILALGVLFLSSHSLQKLLKKPPSQKTTT